MILEKGTTVASVNINPVVDNVHIINTCDQTGIFLSVAYNVQAGVCVPIVEHASGQLVSASLPAKGGETLVLWAYGLGALNHPAEITCCSTPEGVPVAVQPFTIGFSYFDFARFPLRRLGQVIPSYAGGGVGIYQVVFAVPSAPSDLSPCYSTTNNLKILLSGPSSADGAEICLQ
jgi:uncharacterized protein (TIGR03437 family)